MYKLSKFDTVSYSDEPGHEIILFTRSAKDKITGVLRLKAEFTESWQAAKTRQAILAAGQVDLSNWTEANPYSPPDF